MRVQKKKKSICLKRAYRGTIIIYSAIDYSEIVLLFKILQVLCSDKKSSIKIVNPPSEGKLFCVLTFKFQFELVHRKSDKTSKLFKV